MCAHPKSSSEVKNDWLVVAMHATNGSRNEECGTVLTQAWNDSLTVKSYQKPSKIDTSLIKIKRLKRVAFILYPCKDAFYFFFSTFTLVPSGR